MPAYQFPRIMTFDISAAAHDRRRLRAAASRVTAWLTPNFVDKNLPEDPDTPVFRNLDKDAEHLCWTAPRPPSPPPTANSTPMMTAEVPRSAMGVMMPSSAVAE
jgi:hypothetical protein